MITLYHGSNVEVSTPLAKIGRKNLDFGRGFYLTSIRKQATDWANVIAMRKGRDAKGIVSVYHFDKNKAIEDEWYSKYLKPTTRSGLSMSWIVAKEKMRMLSLMWLKAVLPTIM